MRMARETRRKQHMHNQQTTMHDLAWPGRAPDVLWHVLVLVFYLALAVLVSWPLAINLTTGMVGLDQAVDSYQNTWNQWWVASSLSRGQNPFFTPLLYYPDGVDLFWQTLGMSQALLVLPITLAFGPIAGVNSAFLASFVLSGYVVFLLTRQLTGNWAAALVAGTVYSFSPYHMQKLTEGSVELASIQWLPMYLWALDRLLNRPALWRAVLAGVALLWLSLGAWYYAMFALMASGSLIGLRVLATAFQPGTGNERLRAMLRIASWGMLPLALWGIVLAPRLLVLNQAVDPGAWDMRGTFQLVRSAALLDFFLPNPIHPLWGQAIQSWRESQSNDSLIYWNVSLGMIGLPLALVGFVAAWRQNWRWAALLVITFVLALGPLLRITGTNTGIPMPYLLIQDLPGVRIGQRPSHIAILTLLMTAILAAYGVAWLVRGRGQVAHWLLAGMLVAGVIGIDATVERQRLVVWQRPVHRFYASLPKPDGAIMALPMYLNVNRVDNMVPQLVHGWPILGGYIARPPRYSFASETEGVYQLRDGQAEPDDILQPGWPESARRGLAAHRIRYVTLDLTTLRADPKVAAGKAEYFAAVRELLGELGVGPAVLADADLEVYALPRTWPVGPILGLGEGWRPRERQSEANLRWRWMGERATLRLFNPHEQPTLVSLQLTAASFQEARQLQLRLNGQAAGILTIPVQPVGQRLLLMLPAGTSILELQAPASPDPASGGAPLSIRVFALGIEERR